MRSMCAIVAVLIAIGGACELYSGDGTNKANHMESHTLIFAGREMTAEEVQQLEAEVDKSPDNVAAHIKLLGYYVIKGRNDEGAKAAKTKHVLWLIENAPKEAVLGDPYAYIDPLSNPEGYVAVKEAWTKAMKADPENTAILKNAARFFTLHDGDRSEELLLKAQSIEPKNPEFASALGHQYQLQLNRDIRRGESSEYAEKAYQQFKKAYELSDPQRQDFLLGELAKTAFAAGHLDEARLYATQMLEKDSNDGNRGNNVHHGNLILGRIALRDGQLDKAKSYLLAAGRSEGSPQLNSFGPNMQLARELLDKGEEEVVIEYFELCKSFWKHDRNQLAKWTKEVQSDLTPEFGANLYY